MYARLHSKYLLKMKLLHTVIIGILQSQSSSPDVRLVSRTPVYLTQTIRLYDIRTKRWNTRTNDSRTDPQGRPWEMMTLEWGDE